jgi:hypothetical protein
LGRHIGSCGPLNRNFLKDLDRAALLLARACTLLLDENTDEAALRQAIFRRIPKDKLAESVGKVNELARRKILIFRMKWWNNMDG